MTTNTILYGIVTLLLLFLSMDIWKFCSLKKTINKKDIPEDFHIDKYYELKWRINTLLTLGTIIGVMLGYLGFDIKAELEDYRSKIKELDSLTNDLKFKIAKTDSVRNSIDSIFSDQSKKVDTFKTSIDKTEKGIKKIQEENLNQSQVYIVTGIEITMSRKDSAEQTVYYKNLLMNTGQPLPEFKKPPAIHLMNNEKNVENIRIIENTKEYFKITYFELNAMTFKSIQGKEKPKLNKFDILISNQ